MNQQSNSNDPISPAMKERHPRLRLLFILVSLFFGVLAAFHELLPEMDPSKEGQPVIRPPLMHISVEFEKYMDSADCSQHNVVPRIVPCVNNPDPIKLFPQATAYALSSYWAEAKTVPRWLLILTIGCEFTSIILAGILVLMTFSGRFEDRSEFVNILLLPAYFMMIPLGVWLLITRLPIAAVRSVLGFLRSEGTTWSKIRSANWPKIRSIKFGDVITAVFSLILVFSVAAQIFHIDLLAVAIAAVNGVILGALGWFLAPHLPSKWGQLIRSMPPDMLWAAAASTAAVTGTAVEVYLYMLGIFGGLAVTYGIVLLNTIPAVIWTWIERARILSELRAAFRELAKSGE
jgi:hypothetical protein